MNQNLLNTLAIYCDSEIENFKKNELFLKLNNLVEELNYILVCEYGKELSNKKSENIYLSITVFDDKNETVEIFDEGFLTASTMLIFVDKKHRFKFFSWESTEFVEDLNWLMDQLNLIKKQKK